MAINNPNPALPPAPALAIVEDQFRARFVVRCACGRSYDAQEWGCLERVGVQAVPEGDDPVAEPAYRMELRNCVCRSTLALEIVS